MVRREERSAVCALDPILESLVGAVTVKFCCAALVSRHVAAAHSAATPTRMVPRPPLRQLVPSVIMAISSPTADATARPLITRVRVITHRLAGSRLVADALRRVSDRSTRPVAGQ